MLDDVEGEYLTDVLERADERLTEIREYDDSRAGGLVVSMTKNHANKIAVRLDELTGETPLVVHSDNENALADIENFANSTQKWIVAVKMVSEGVDIRRLRVGVYATNVLQELTFRQVIGRVVRRIDDYDDWAYFYVPQHQRLVKFMKRIKDEISHVISLEKKKRVSTEGKEWGATEMHSEASPLVSLGTERNPDEDLVISENEAFNLNEAARWRDMVQEIVGVKINEWEGRKIIALYEQTATPPPQEAKVERTEVPIHIREQKLRKRCNQAAFAVACRLEAESQTHKKPQDIVKTIHYEWSQRDGNHTQSEAGIEELERKLKWLHSGTIEDNPGRYIR